MLGTTETIKLESLAKIDFIDLTDRIVKLVRRSNITNGTVTAYTKHTTTAVRINENEELLVTDLRQFLERIAPELGLYNHDEIEMRKGVPEDEPRNAHAHLKALLLGSSETIPIVQGALQIGKWQSVLFIELDGPRTREVVVQLIGK